MLMAAALPEHLKLDRVKTPIGRALLVTDERGFLHAFDWEDHEPRLQRLLRLHYGSVALSEGRSPDAIRQALQAYWAGRLTALDRIECRTGGTPFQRTVWAALR